MKWYLQGVVFDTSVPPKELGGKVVVRRGQTAVRSAPLHYVCAARSSLLFLFFFLKACVASFALVELCLLETVVRSPVALREVLVGRWIVLEIHRSTRNRVEFGLDQVRWSSWSVWPWTLPPPLRVVFSFPWLK
ncbi:unnamed protein product [Microthlaspi erraticum]|uniref:Uncharacterized protein n=1 Tax=Microthlaspi erraticum TaxID=1685480 RepID=A0A6D2K0P5_9BRAS|nr:unnamed protein product [Microthlaspi erraticum]